MCSTSRSIHGAARRAGLVLVLSSAAAAGPSGSSNAEPPALPNPLTLEAALDFARAQHPELRVAAASIEVARADSVAARTRRFNPELGTGLSRGGDGFGSGDDRRWELGLSREFELGGKRARREEVAQARLRTTTSERDARRQEIESRLRAAFRRALFLERRLQGLHELAELDGQIVASTNARVRDGSVTPLTGRLTELDLLRVESRLSRTRSDLVSARLDLGLALGTALPEPHELSGVLVADSLRASDERVADLALGRRAELAVLRGVLAEKQSQQLLARLEGRPNVTLGAGLAWERRTLAGTDFRGDPAVLRGIDGVEDRSQEWTARLDVPLPIWQRNQGERAKTLAEAGLARAEIERFAWRTRLEAISAARRLRQAVSLSHRYLAREPRTRADLALVRDAYRDGRINLDSYLVLKGELVDTLLDGWEAEAQYWEARAALETVTGTDLATLDAGGTR